MWASQQPNQQGADMDTHTEAAFAKYIATLLKVADQDAQLVLNEMRSNGFNFQFSTQEKFNREAKIALKVVRIPS
jgi:hypothetical protein